MLGLTLRTPNELLRVDRMETTPALHAFCTGLVLQD